jgi:intracellular proteinase inhibitor BsuPI
MHYSMIDGFRWLGAVVLIVTLVASCQHPVGRQDSGVETQSGTPELGLVLRATKGVYAQGEPLELTLEVVNRSQRPITLGFRTSQRYDLLIQNAQGQEVWRWSAERMFAQMLGQEVLSPNGGKLTYHVVVREKIPRGAYTVIGVVPAVDARLSARLDITIQ